MEAVLYCIRECDRMGSNSPAAGEVPVRTLYEQGYRLVIEKEKRMRECYDTVLDSFCDYGNRCLRDTVTKGMPEFFKRYDPLYHPQDTLLTLDYPVLTRLERKCGVDAAAAYMDCIRLEQVFLRQFDRDYVESILIFYAKGRENAAYMVENIVSLVLQNTVGHLLLAKPLSETGFTPDDCRRLADRILTQTKEQLKTGIGLAIDRLTAQCAGDAQALAVYLKQEADNLAARLANGAAHGVMENVVWR